MPDAGFLGAPSAEQMPKSVEVPETAVEAADDVAVAEREALKEMTAESQQEGFLEQAIEAEEAPTTTINPAAPIGQAPTVAAEPVTKDEITLEVERILEEGLGDYVPDMPEEARQRFLKKGGEVAAQLSIAVRTLNVQVAIVVELIKEWLMTIPGVNRYFIEQESKIKTDLLVQLANAKREEKYGAPTQV